MGWWPGGLLLALLAGRAQAQGPVAQDSLLQRLPRTHGAARADVLYQLARHALPDSAQTLHYAALLLAEARAAHYPAGVGKAYFCRALAYLDLGRYDSAFVYARQSLQTAQAHGLTQLQGWNYNTLGEIYQRQGRFLKAREAYREAEQVKQQLGDQKGAAVTAYNLAQLNLKLHYYAEAEQYFRRAEALYARLGQPVVARFLLPYDQAQVQYARGHYQAALADFGRATTKIDSTLGRADFSKSLLYARLARTYLALHDYARALTTYQQALRTGPPDSDEQRTDDELTLARLYRETGQPARAGPVATRVLAQARARRDYNLVAAAYAELAQDQAATGAHRQANASFKRQLAAKARAEELAGAREMALLQVEHEAAGRDQEMRRLRADNERRRLRGEQGKLLVRAGSAGLLLLLGLLGLLGIRYRDKQRAHRRLSAEQAHTAAAKQQLQRTQAELHQTVRDKELLMQEIHHRTQNNLYIVRSLLRAQARQLTDEQALLALEDSSYRVEAISLIHQQLHQSGNPSRLALGPYVQALVANVASSLGTNAGVTVSVRADEVPSAVDLALPLGLIVNELLTNALKHAHPPGTPGRIEVELRQVSAQELRLVVADDGPGPDPAAPPQTGLRLVRGLAQQLRAELQWHHTAGVRVELRVPLLFPG